MSSAALKPRRTVPPAGERLADALAFAGLHAVDAVATTATVEARAPSRPVRLELRHLRYFVAVAEELSFTRAAERLHMAQPPLSTQIRQLEDELGAEVFVREKRRVYLTQPGRQMLAHARTILAATVDAKEAVRRTASGEIGELRLG